MTAPDTTNSTSDPAITLQEFHIPLEEAYTVELSHTVKDALSKMDQHNIDQLPVVDLGYFGPMVITRKAVTAAPWASARTPIRDLLGEHSNDPQQRVPATTPLKDAKELLIQYDWVLTTDQDDNPIGLATVGDALGKLLDNRQGCCAS